MPRACSQRKANTRNIVAAAIVTSVLGGCASDPFLAADVSRFRTFVELEETPFFAQEKYQCGPAALATLLQSSGLTVTPEELVPKVYLPARHGSLQPELLAASRGYGKMPYVISPEFPALLAEVDAGRPVLVLQNLGVSALPRWHYAVVIGYSADAGEMILRSGTDRRRVTAASVFARTWQRSGNWGMILLTPGELPAGDDADGYLAAVAALESAGQLENAETAYRAALVRWERNSLAHLGLGNTAWANGRPADAEREYRRALALQPADATLLNNLAAVLAAQGDCRDAAEILARADPLVAEGHPLFPALAETRREVEDCTANRP